MPDDTAVLTARPKVPTRLETRRIQERDRMLFGHAVAALVGNAQKVLAYAPGSSGAAAAVLVFGEIAPTIGGQSGASTVLFDTFICFNVQRTAAAAANRAFELGPEAPSFHPLVDPSTPAIPVVIVFEDFVAGVITAGACETVFGLHQHITAGDITTLVGVGFRAGADHIWHTFVNDCPTDVAPVTVRRDTTLAILSSSFHRLSIVIDGRTKKISWFVDDVLVDSWTPAAPLDQMRPAPGPLCMWSFSYPIGGAGNIYVHAGGIPQLRVMNQAT